jgi:hypothetical protein
MHGDYKRFERNTSAQRIVDALRDRQHLHPHEAVGRSLSTLSSRLGIRPDVPDTAARALSIDGGASIGRLRNSQLVQLGRTIERLWERQTSGVSQMV